MPKGYSNKTGLPFFLKGHKFLGGTKGCFKKGQVSAFKGKKHTDKTKQLIREQHLGKDLKHTGSFKKGQTSWNKGIKHTDETKRKIKEKRINYFLNGGISPNKGKHLLQISGKNSHLWKGGITPLTRKIRGSFEYRQWRSDVFTRDDFICQICGIRGGKLHADHIKLFSTIFWEYKIKTLEEALNCSEFWNINNGQTLCEKCHRIKTTKDLKGRKQWLQDIN